MKHCAGHGGPISGRLISPRNPIRPTHSEGIGRIWRSGDRLAGRRIAGETTLHATSAKAGYLPMQKSRKITSRISSTSTRPVSRPKARAAMRSSSASRSSWPASRAPAPAVAPPGYPPGAAVALAGDQGRLGAGQEILGVAGQGRQ